MADKYVSKTDLEYYHGRIKTVFATQTALEGKVDKVTGKGLSTNDFTTTLKNKLDNISAGAQVNVIETVKRNGTALTVTNKAVDISVPVNVSDLTNDSGFITSASVPQASASTPLMDGTASVGSETAWARGDHRHPTDTSRAAASHAHGNITNAGAITATAVTPANGDAIVMTDSSASGKLVKSTIAFDGSSTGLFLNKKGEFGAVDSDSVVLQSGVDLLQNCSSVLDGLETVASAIAGVTSFDIQVVTTLPTTGTKGVIYLVAHSHGTQDAYDEYIWTGSAYEKIGSTDIDLSGYWAKSELTAMTTAEIDALFTTE